jgi:hypothetical protein
MWGVHAAMVQGGHEEWLKTRGGGVRMRPAKNLVKNGRNRLSIKR